MAQIEETWDKTGLAEFKAGLSLSRREDDETKLSRLFAEAALSPMLKQALDWAKDHDIEFIIDRNVASGGVYHAGTGVLAISEEMAKPENRADAIGALVQEIRHAWQDWNWFLSSPTYTAQVTETYMRGAVLQADAEAFGLIATRQWEIAHQLQRLQAREEAGNDVGKSDVAALRQELKASQENTGAVLWEGFKSWFSGGEATAYGVALAQKKAKGLGLDHLVQVLAEHKGIATVVQKNEFDPTPVQQKAPKNAGVPLKDAKSLAPLGVGFDGGQSYLSQAPAGYLENNVLSPKLAEAFYKAGQPRAELMDAVLRAETREQRSNTRRPGSPRLRSF